MERSQVLPLQNEDSNHTFYIYDDCELCAQMEPLPVQLSQHLCFLAWWLCGQLMKLVDILNGEEGLESQQQQLMKTVAYNLLQDCTPNSFVMEVFQYA